MTVFNFVESSVAAMVWEPKKVSAFRVDRNRGMTLNYAVYLSYETREKALICRSKSEAKRIMNQMIAHWKEVNQC